MKWMLCRFRPYHNHMGLMTGMQSNLFLCDAVSYMLKVKWL